MENIINPLIGGILIGLASSIMLGGLGRITGISGIVASAIDKPSKVHLWRYTFIAGLILGGVMMKSFSPDLFSYSLENTLPKLILAGLIVGFGTRLGSGCTSGHGVCGLARLSKRSFVATGVFILFGIITVTLIRGLSL